MFFSIKKDSIDSRFDNNYQFGNFWLNLDDGWNKYSVNGVDVFYKGYCDHCNLSDLLDKFVDDPTPNYYGNFCVIIYNEGSFSITHDLQRKFPIWNYSNSLITNLSIDNKNQYKFTGSKIVNGYYDFGHDREFVKHNKYVKTFKNSTLEYADYCLKLDTPNAKTLDDACAQYSNILVGKANSFINHDYRKKIFLSGGYDSMLIYSLVKEKSNDEDIFFDNYLIEKNNFLEKNYSNLEFRDYEIKNSMHHWLQKTIVTSGFHAEFYLFKHYTMVYAWCAYKNINFLKEFGNYKSYGISSFTRDNRAAQFKDMWINRAYIQDKYPDANAFQDYIIDFALHNYQHFHLGNTLTWTPLKDIRLLNLFFVLSDDAIIDQILNNRVERYIIEKQSKDLLSYISKNKNSNVFENFKNFQPFKTYILKSLKEKNLNEIAYIKKNS